MTTASPTTSPTADRASAPTAHLPASVTAALGTYFDMLRDDPRDQVPRRTELPIDLVIEAMLEHYSAVVGLSYQDRITGDFGVIAEDNRAVKLQVRVSDDPDHPAPSTVLITTAGAEYSDTHLFSVDAAAARPHIEIACRVVGPGRDDHYLDPTLLMRWLHYWLRDARMPESLTDNPLITWN